MGYLNEKEFEEAFTADVQEELNDLLEMGCEIENELDVETIMEYAYNKYAAWQVALIIVGDYEE
jgi:hypothetical protein